MLGTCFIYFSYWSPKRAKSSLSSKGIKTNLNHKKRNKDPKNKKVKPSNKPNPNNMRARILRNNHCGNTGLFL